MAEDSSKHEGEQCPYPLLKEEFVREAVKKEFGSDATLLSWKVVDFTNKGDNYASIVTSIEVSYKINDTKASTTYVSKLGREMDVGAMDDLFRDAYYKEPMVLFEIIPKINYILEAVNDPALNCPEIFSWNNKHHEEVFIMNDLRKKGFFIYDRMKGMDVAHATLVFNELGRFHAASVLIKDHLKEKDLYKSFPFLKEKWMTDDSLMETFTHLFIGQFDAAAKFLSDYPGYEDAIEWINQVKTKGVEVHRALLADYDSKFEVICHGDCWNNNILFRYNKTGNPVEVALVDLQVSRKTTFANEINYFIYSSLTGKIRNENFISFLKIYHKSFSRIMNLAGKEMPFSLQECIEEVKRTINFGVVSALFILPIILAKGEDICSLEVGMESFLELSAQNISKIGSHNVVFRERFLTALDDRKNI